MRFNIAYNGTVVHTQGIESVEDSFTPGEGIEVTEEALLDIEEVPDSYDFYTMGNQVFFPDEEISEIISIMDKYFKQPWSYSLS